MIAFLFFAPKCSSPEGGMSKAATNYVTKIQSNQPTETLERAKDAYVFFLIREFYWRTSKDLNSATPLI